MLASARSRPAPIDPVWESNPFRPVRSVPRWIIACATAIAALSLLPLLFVVGVTLGTPSSTVAGLLLRSRIAELLVNTGLLVALAVPLCVVVGAGLAWVTERTDLPGRKVWSVLAVAPLAIPAFVQSYAWTSLIPGLHGLWAAVFLSVIAYFPFVFLPTAAALRRLSPDVEEVAASLGLPPRAVFMRVVVPHLAPATAAGGLLVGLHLLAEYGLYAMLRFDTFTTAIFDQFQSSYNGPAANMMASVLIVLSLILLGMAARIGRHGRLARVGPGATRAAPRNRGKWTLILATLLPLTATVCALVVPLLTVFRWLALGDPAAWGLWRIASTLENTVLLGCIGATIAVVAALPVSWLSARMRGSLVRVMEGASYTAAALPGIVVALGLVTISLALVPSMYQTFATLLLAYLVLFLPRALAGLRTGFAQVPPELEWVAASLGIRPGTVFRKITLRLAAPSLAAAAALVFLAIVNELTATLLLAPIGTRTLATQFWALTGELDYAAAAPFAAVMIALSLPLSALLYWQSFRAAGR